MGRAETDQLYSVILGVFFIPKISILLLSHPEDLYAIIPLGSRNYNSLIPGLYRMAKKSGNIGNYTK